MPNIEIGVDSMVKGNFMYVGIDLHKETHTAVMIDCYNQKLGEITFPNRPADFPKLVTCQTADYLGRFPQIISDGNTCHSLRSMRQKHIISGVTADYRGLISVQLWLD